MLTTTSVFYVLLAGSKYMLELPNDTNCDDMLLRSYVIVVIQVSNLIYAYNFYVYLVTGKQFRADLRSLLCSCRCPNVNAANDNNAAAVTVATRRHIDTRV